MTNWWWLLLILALFLLYLSNTAGRLDRLHHRVESSRNALDAALLRRANVSIEAAASGFLDPATALVVADVADRVADDSSMGKPRRPGERASEESDLTAALGAAFAEKPWVDDLAGDPAGEELVNRLAGACHGVQYARRFHNDAVRACRSVRLQRKTRWFRLAGSAEMPQSVEMADSVPAGLAGR